GLRDRDSHGLRIDHFHSRDIARLAGHYVPRTQDVYEGVRCDGRLRLGPETAVEAILYVGGGHRPAEWRVETDLRVDMEDVRPAVLADIPSIRDATHNT